MIFRVLRSLKRRGLARVELLRQSLVAARARDAVALVPPVGEALLEPEQQRRELLGRLATILSLDHLTRFALQADSIAGYDALAERLRRQGPRGAFPAAVSLARAMQQHQHPRTRVAIDAAIGVRRRSQRGDWLALVQLLLLEGRDEEAARLLDELGPAGWEGDRLRGDIINPFTGVTAKTLAQWEELAAGIYRGSGVEPFRLGDATRTGIPFDRLTADVPAGSVGGPLVSVVMTTFRPDAGALVSARSILAQSWRELELLVMDDASGPDHDRVLDQLAALDERVRVVRSPYNAGTYVRRNEALHLARGDYVTMQDSDDWSHPRRLELQVRHLEEHPELPANLVVALRVTPELEFVQRRGLHLRLCEPAIMIRRSTIERIGFFDSVRKSADSEYRVRINQTWGSDVPVLRPRTPLVLMRSERSSLSGADFGDGWTQPSRFAYRSAYLRWQAHELEQGRTPYLPFPLEHRPFPAPARIEGRTEGPARWATVIAGDARRNTLLEATDRILAALEQTGREGVAVLDVPSFRSPQAMLAAAPVQQLVNDGAVGELSLSDEAEVGTLVFAHADAALGLPREPGAIRVQRVVVLVEESQAGPDGRSYAAPLVEEAVQRFFGIAPEWAASLND